jgi:ADP-heptose:LPS heptosyltransferase
MKKKIIIRGNIRNPKNILVDLPHGLGDLIMCFPLFASIKTYNPEIKITALSPNKASQLLLKHNRNIDETFSLHADFTAKGFIKYITTSIPALRKKVKGDIYDLYISVHPNIIRTANRIFCGIINKIENTQNIHKTSECLNILSEMRIPPVIDYTLHTSTNALTLEKYGLKLKQYVVLDYYPQHFSADPRRWECIDDLAGILKEHGIATVATGINPGHRTCNADIDIVNRTGFDELLEIIAGAKACVSMDTGMFHLSYALKTPVIGLFGPVDPADRMPFDSQLPVNIIYKKLDCSPCIKNKVNIPCSRPSEPYKCMRSITPDEVMRELLKIFKENN